MEAPRYILERLALVDANLVLKWLPHKSRWLLLRKSPVTPNRPPEPVRLWCAQDGSYLPLDNRLIVWLRANDLSRKFKDHDKKYWGKLFEAELKERQDVAQAEIQKRRDEEHAELTKALAWSIKEGERARKGTIPAKEFRP